MPTSSNNKDTFWDKVRPCANLFLNCYQTLGTVEPPAGWVQLVENSVLSALALVLKILLLPLKIMSLLVDQFKGR